MSSRSRMRQAAMVPATARAATVRFGNGRSRVSGNVISHSGRPSTRRAKSRPTTVAATIPLPLLPGNRHRQPRKTLGKWCAHAGQAGRGAARQWTVERQVKALAELAYARIKAPRIGQRLALREDLRQRLRRQRLGQGAVRAHGDDGAVQFLPRVHRIGIGGNHDCIGDEPAAGRTHRPSAVRANGCAAVRT
jgi:hypothetical protein